MLSTLLAMKSTVLELIFLITTLRSIHGNETNETRITDKILNLLEHFKQEDPVGLPGIDIPDPVTVPSVNEKSGLYEMTFNDMKIYGTSQFRILRMEAELAEMKVNTVLVFSSLHIQGDYAMTYLWKRPKGRFAINMTNLNVEGFVLLGTEIDGKLRVRDVEMDITNENMQMEFENLDKFLLKLLNSFNGGTFRLIKPYILREAYDKIRQEVNANLEKYLGNVEFSNSISPLDMLISDTRNKIKAMNMEPFHLKDNSIHKYFYELHLSETWLRGMSSFYRVGDISMSLINNTAMADLKIGTLRLSGDTEWDLTFGGLLSRSGAALFSVEYVHARVVLVQPLDTRKRATVKVFDLDAGNVQVRCDGVGTLDYVVELLVNVLPNLLRNQIVDSVERLIKTKIQEKLDLIDVEAIIREEISMLENADEDGLETLPLKTFDIPSQWEKEWGLPFAVSP